MTSFSQLPQELVDHIIDFLHDNKETLSQCALVCHSWLHTCRYHLFNSIYATVPYEGTLAYGLEPPEVKEHDFEAFITFFQRDSSSSVRHYIRHFLIRGTMHRAQCILRTDKVDTVLALFPSLRSLSLLSVRLSSPDAFKRYTRLSRSAFALDRLAMSDVAAAPIGTMNKQPILDVLSLFSSIDTLYFSDFYAGRRDTDSLSALPHHKARIAKLSTIRLRDFDLLQYLLEHSVDMDAVTSFSCTITHSEHIVAANRFLAVLQPECITHLELDFRWYEHTTGCEQMWDKIELPALQSLESCRLHVAFPPSSNVLPLMWTFTMTLLSKLPSSSLTHLAMHLYFPVSPDPNINADDDEAQGPLPISPMDRLGTLDWDWFLRILNSMRVLSRISIYIALRVDFDGPSSSQSTYGIRDTHGASTLSNLKSLEQEREVYEKVRRALEDRLGGLKRRGRISRISWQRATWKTLEL